MDIRELVPIGTKTTMRIGGAARSFAELRTPQDAEEAVRVAAERGLPLIVLGSGSNTIFADGTVEALVVRIAAATTTIDGTTVRVDAGKNLPMLVNELAQAGLDLSALTGIPGTVGGALFGNAGQGPGGVWIDTFVRSVRAYMDGGWRTLTRDECHFRYRESGFKDTGAPVIIWSAELAVPQRPTDEVQAEVQRLLQRRLDTQPHVKTAGSCFKALPDGTPAWKLVDAAGLRGKTIGGIQIAEKHANFLLNVGNATFADTLEMTALIRRSVPQIAGIEMRLYGNDGQLVAQGA